MKRGIEAATVLVLAFVVCPLAAVASISANVPAWLWVALVTACLSYAPARAWSVKR
ncbi:MAG TPA: hypothetical protein VKJ07_17325 [Mycobacteriales bacterium]|nr:hypothetical protein [Mycobacteriales bacterium]